MATVPMTAVMLVGQRISGYGRLPPEAVIENAAARAGDATSDTVADDIDDFDDLDDQRVDWAWRAGHLLTGAALGALYSVVVRPMTPFLPGTARGALYALAIWFVSYQGLVPAVELMPPASEDDRRRQATNVAAHAVFGVVLGVLATDRRRPG